MNPFTVNDLLHDLFGSRMGSTIADQRTYLPTGEIRFTQYGPYLSVNGNRTFDADQWDYMVKWMQSCAPQDLAAFKYLRIS